MQDFKAANQQQSLQLLQQYAKGLPDLDAAEQTYRNRVMGCTAEVRLEFIFNVASPSMQHSAMANADLYMLQSVQV